MDCPIKYIGQMGQTFYIGNQEHAQQLEIITVTWGTLNHILNMGTA
jgi:hypothetical protein